MRTEEIVPPLAMPGGWDVPPSPRTEPHRRIFSDAVIGRRPGFRPLRADVVVPASAGPVPIVVWIHGGAWAQGDHRDSSPFTDVVVDAFSSAGVAVAVIGYRLTGEATFPAQLHDVKSAVRWIRLHESVLGVDARGVVTMGESAGGHLALLAALVQGDPVLEGRVGVVDGSSDVVAAVSWFGPTNLTSMQSQMLPGSRIDHDAAQSPESRLLGAPVPEVPDRAEAASPVSHVGAKSPPVLLIHGMEDRVVPAAQSEELARALADVGATARVQLVAGADHGFAGVPVGPMLDESVTFVLDVLDSTKRTREESR